ncbi:MAG: PilZ domain-containing protein [Planctomycetes bacterium]|nr:PilZ domain-containing protein [Planctomycetota bacterium]
MASDALQNVAHAVVQLAKRQGSVTSGDVRAELRLAGLADADWPKVVALAGKSLLKRQAKYFHKDSFNARAQKQQAQQQALQRAIRRLIKQHQRRTKEEERRGQNRVDFVQQVEVRAEDGKKSTLLSRDLSLTGIRLIGTKGLLGQKVQLALPTGDGETMCRLLARILWTCAIGDDLFENGGIFLELVD